MIADVSPCDGAACPSCGAVSGVGGKGGTRHPTVSLCSPSGGGGPVTTRASRGQGHSGCPLSPTLDAVSMCFHGVTCPPVLASVKLVLFVAFDAQVSTSVPGALPLRLLHLQTWPGRALVGLTCRTERGCVSSSC